MATTLLPSVEIADWRARAAASQRDRLLVAMADACVENGYAQTRVADVIARAGVSRRTFYEFFRNLEECFLATYDRGVNGLTDVLANSVDELGDDADWKVVLGTLLTTYLGALAAEPTFTQFALVEVLAAGPAARQRYLEVVERFHGLLRQIDDLARADDPNRPPTPDLELSIFAGGLGRLVMTEVLAGRGHRLPDHLEGLRALGIRTLSGAVT